MSKSTERLDRQLQAMFAKTENPPMLKELRLEKFAKEREHKQLLIAVSILSFFWTMMSFIAALLIMEQDQFLGESMMLFLLLGLFGAGVLAAALLHTEQHGRRMDY